jgi:hypothetical protein
MDSKLSFKDVFLCSNYNCRAILDITDEIFKLYFNSKTFKCPSCQTDLNLWEVGLKQFELSVFGWHYSLLGCQTNFIEIILKPNEIYTLDLSKTVGEGKILYINYSPSSNGLTPLQMHLNVPNMHFIPKRIHLYPRPLRKNCKETKTQIMYWFAPKEVYDNLSIMLMLDAFQKVYQEEYRHMAISAQSAIEILIYRFFEEQFKSIKLKDDRIEDFLSNRATYSPQLFTLLPLLAKKEGFPFLQKEIIESLTTLNKYRNNMIHQGKTKMQLNDSDFIKMVLSAFFAVKYFKIIHRM